MSKHKMSFQPRAVPIATFEMFGGPAASQLPTATLAASIRDPTIKGAFRRLNKSSATAREEAFNEIIKSIPQIDDQEELANVTRTCISVLDTSLTEFQARTRYLSIQLIDSIMLKLGKEVINYAGEIFPPLLLLYCDASPDVAQAAKSVYSRYFTTPEKRNAMMSKLRREICLKLRAIYQQLLKPEWHLNEADTNENWGRLCNSALILSSNLLFATKGAKNVFTSMGNIPVEDWLRPKDGAFPPRATSSFRSGAYVFLNICAQFQLCDVKNVDQYLALETSPQCQEKLFKLVNILIEKENIDIQPIKDILINSLSFYYQPEKIGLRNLIDKVSDPEYFEKVIRVTSDLSDPQTSLLIFQDLWPLAEQKQVSDEFVKFLLENALNNKSRFYSQVPLSSFISISNNVMDILKTGDEQRCFSYLSINKDTAQIQEWLKNRKSFSPSILTKIINLIGNLPIRQIWDSIEKVPLKDEKGLVEFIHAFARNEEISIILKTWPQTVNGLLQLWEGDFSVFKCPEMEPLIPELLGENPKLLRILISIFPDDQSVLDIAAEKIAFILDTKGEFDPEIFEYFTPKPDLLTKILLSPAVEVLEENDKIVSMLIRHIPTLLDTVSPSQLATATAKLVEATEIDPEQIGISPIDAPAFCYEYWSRIGFENMNNVDFCFMLNSYLESAKPWTEVELYLQCAEWKSIAYPISKYVSGNLDLVEDAQAQHQLSALACIAALNNLTFNSPMLKQIDGMTLFSMSHLEPPHNVIDDRLSKTIRSEWGQILPERNTENIRAAVAYLQMFLATAEHLEEFVALANREISSDNRLNFFLTLRICSLLADVAQPFESLPLVMGIYDQITALYPFPEVVENEMQNAARVARFLSVDIFNKFIEQIIPKFATAASSLMSRITIPLVSYFNVWEDFMRNAEHILDFENPNCWYPITEALNNMPMKKREDYLQDFSKMLPTLFNSLQPTSPEFIMLITAFPSSAMKWSTSLGNNKFIPLTQSMELGGSSKVFQTIAHSALELKLESTKISTDFGNREINAVYCEDESSIPVKLKLSFNKTYPFSQVKVKCEFGDEGEACETKVLAAIISQQSVNAGIIAWHNFLIQRLKDGEPCTVCYSYLSEEMKKPTVSCPTCGNKFHAKCLSKWFSKCLKPTCPYCGSPWDEKKKKSKK